MLCQLVDEETRGQERPQTGNGLRLGHDRQMTRRLLDHLGDGNRSPQEIDVPDSEADRLAPTQAEHASDEHQDPVVPGHLTGPAARDRPASG